MFRIEYLNSQTCKHVAVNVAETQIPKALERNRPQHDHPAACVIAQQYSSATFFSLRFLSRNKRIRRAF
jgi:hypothetical protein